MKNNDYQDWPKAELIEGIERLKLYTKKIKAVISS